MGTALSFGAGLRRAGWSVCLLSGLGLAAGCSEAQKQELKTAVASVQQTVKTVAAAPIGKVELGFPRPLTIDKCYARLIPAGPDRPAVLQLLTHLDAKEEKAPAIFLQAEAPSSVASELAGKTLPAEAFAWQGDPPEVWHTPLDQPVEVTVSAADALTVTCSLKDVEFVAPGQPAVKVSGQIIGLIK